MKLKNNILKILTTLILLLTVALVLPGKVKAENEYIPLTEFTVDELAQISLVGSANHSEYGLVTAEQLEIGDTLPIILDEYGSFNIRLIDRLDGLVFDFEEIILKNYHLSSVNNTSSDSRIINNTLPNILTKFPKVWKSVIDELFLIKPSKLDGVNAYEFYIENGPKTKKYNGENGEWWIDSYAGFSSSSRQTKCFGFVSSTGEIHRASTESGNPTYNNYGQSKGVSPAFKLGKPIEIDESFPWTKSSNIGLLNNDVLEVIIPEDPTKKHIELRVNIFESLTFEDDYWYRFNTASTNDKDLIVKLTFEDGFIMTLKENAPFYVEKHNNYFTFTGDFGVVELFNGETINVETTKNAEFYFYRTIIDITGPEITGPNSFVTNVNDSKDLEYFLSEFTAVDKVDGDVTESITVVTDNYTQNKNVLNTNHYVTIKAVDLSGNETEHIFIITVVDTTPPILTGSSQIINVSYKSTWKAENFKASLTVSDNHSNLTTDDVVIKSNGYLGNEEKLGTYIVVFEVSDASGNKTTFEKQVKVVDDIDPEFTGPETITSSITTMLTASDIRKYLTAFDEIDGALTNKIKITTDTYSGNGHKKGTYSIKYEVTDNAGNTAYKTITVKRVENILQKVIILDGSNIRTLTDIPLTFEDMIDILTETGAVIVDSETEFFLIDEDYFNHEDQVGVYTVLIEVKAYSGTESEHELKIYVTDPPISGTGRSPAAEWILKNGIILFAGALLLIGALYVTFKPKKRRRRR